MPDYSRAKHHIDPPPADTPKDFDVYGFAPAPKTIYKPRRVWKRALTAAACAAVISLTYALIPIAFAVGGAAIGVWFVGAEIYDWLDSKTAD
jgi:hypothetical protein